MTDNALAFLDVLPATDVSPATGLDWLENAVVAVDPALMEETDEDRHKPDVIAVKRDGSREVANRLERLQLCGTYMLHKPDVKTGRRVGFHYRCDLPLLCDRCREWRAEKEANRVLAALDGGSAWLKRVPAGEDTAKVVRGLDAGDYRRYPMPNETWILHRDPNAGGEPVEAVEDLPWDEMVATPEGSNVSGKMKRETPPPAKDKKDDDVATKMVKVPAVAFDDPLERADYEQREDADRCWEFAILATAHIPADLGTLYLLLPELMKHFQSAMEKCAYRVSFFVYDWQRVREDEVDWEPYREHIRKKLQAQGYTSEAVADEDTYARHYGQGNRRDDA